MDDLSVEFPTARGQVLAVDGVSFSIAPSEIVGLVGESESGKSSTALALMGLARPPGKISGGSVHFLGRDLLDMDGEEIRRIRGGDLSLIVQNPRAALNPMLSAGDQIVNVLRAHETLERGEAEARAMETLRLVGINDPGRRMQAYPHELSGGMAQRVLIAMALVCQPRLLIADEPTSGLDVTIQAQILDDLLTSVQTTGSAALIVTQDLGVVANYCDRVLVMYGGQLVESADVRTFFAAASHPSSRALLTAQAALGRVSLHGDPFDHHERPHGCILAPRCPWVTDECRLGEVELVDVAPGHRVRCLHWRSVSAAAATTVERVEAR